jgi:hypothetical protein
VAVLRRLSSGGRAQAAERCGLGGKTRGKVFRRQGKQGLAAELGRRAQAVELGGGAQAAEPWRWGKRGWRRARLAEKERGMDWFDRFCRLSRSHVFAEYSLCVDGSIPVYYNQTNAYWGWFHPILVLV